jgi:hypothetical protein
MAAATAACARWTPLPRLPPSSAPRRRIHSTATSLLPLRGALAPPPTPVRPSPPHRSPKVKCGDPDVDARLEAKISEFVGFVERQRGGQDIAQLRLSFFEKRRRQAGWFMLQQDERLYWEQWWAAPGAAGVGAGSQQVLPQSDWVVVHVPRLPQSKARREQSASHARPASCPAPRCINLAVVQPDPFTQDHTSLAYTDGAPRCRGARWTLHFPSKELWEQQRLCSRPRPWRGAESRARQVPGPKREARPPRCNLAPAFLCPPPQRRLCARRGCSQRWRASSLRSCARSTTSATTSRPSSAAARLPSPLTSACPGGCASLGGSCWQQGKGRLVSASGGSTSGGGGSSSSSHDRA